VCWIRADVLERRGLDAGLAGADRLYAVSAGGGTGAVADRHTAVLLDSDATAWSSWNAYAAELAARPGRSCPHLRRRHHGARLLRPYPPQRLAGINSPKGQGTPLPRPRAAPCHRAARVLDLVWRQDERRSSILVVIDALRGDGDFGTRDPGARLPEGDPYRNQPCGTPADLRWEPATTRQENPGPGAGPAGR
jgi:hypothetical protein